MNDGTVTCWGNNNTYELGAVTTTKCSVGSMMYMCSATPVSVAVTGATAIGLGNQHTCAATASGTYCWGYNKYGAFGDGSTTTSATPHLVPQRAGATSITGGVYHGCSLATGTISCSGENVTGEVGNGTAMVQTTAVPAMMNATSLALGEYLSCALDMTGQPLCWGTNTFGEISADMQAKLLPTAVTGVPQATAIAAGRDHVCFVLPGKTVSCRGNNAAGQLDVATLADTTAISANHNHTCAQKSDGSVACVGEGYGTVPVAIALPEPARSITSGVSHDCALAASGHVYCWGSDDFGQLGNGTPSSVRSLVPAAVPLCP